MLGMAECAASECCVSDEGYPLLRYVLDAYGGIWPFGGAPRVQSPHYVRADVYRDIVLIGRNRGYIVDNNGRMWPFGGAPAVQHSLTWTGLNLTAGAVASP